MFAFGLVLAIIGILLMVIGLEHPQKDSIQFGLSRKPLGRRSLLLGITGLLLTMVGVGLCLHELSPTF